MIFKKLNTHVVDLVGVIDDDLAKKVSSKLLTVDRQGKARVILAINSFGGWHKSMEKIIETIHSMKNDVYGVVVGAAHSAAFIILQNCKERIACNHDQATLMFHHSNMSIESMQKLVEKSKQIEAEGSLDTEKGKIITIKGHQENGRFVATSDPYFEENMKLWVKRSGRTRAVLMQHIDKHLTPQEALDLGLLDGLDKYLKVTKVKPKDQN